MENLFLHEVLNVNLFIIDCFKGKVSRSVPYLDKLQDVMLIP